MGMSSTEEWRHRRQAGGRRWRLSLFYCEQHRRLREAMARAGLEEVRSASSSRARRCCSMSLPVDSGRRPGDTPPAHDLPYSKSLVEVASVCGAPDPAWAATESPTSSFSLDTGRDGARLFGDGSRFGVRIRYVSTVRVRSAPAVLWPPFLSSGPVLRSARRLVSDCDWAVARVCRERQVRLDDHLPKRQPVGSQQRPAGRRPDCLLQ
jgi:hypothetical protein